MNQDLAGTSVPLKDDEAETEPGTSIPIWDTLQVIMYTLLPLIVMAVASGLLYFFVDESHQTLVNNHQLHIEISGSGSTIASTSFWRWIKVYSEQQQYGGNTSITFASTGSSAGEAGVFNDDFQFGVLDSDSDISDARYFLNDDPSQNTNQSSFINPLTPAHLGAILLPVFSGALGIVYNIPSLRKTHVPLVFTGKVLGDIFCGQINLWNDPQIQTLNPNVTLPKKQITVIVLDPSKASPSDGFAGYLAKHSTAFQSIVNTSNGTTWPNTFIQGQDMFELMYLSSIMPHSITFTPMEAVALVESSGEEPQVARLINTHGKTTDPTVNSVAVATSAKSPTMTFLRHNFIGISNSNDTDAYPLSVMNHLLIREHYFYFTPGSDSECTRVREMVHFMYFVLTDSRASETLTVNHWIPISDNILEGSLQALSAVTCNRLNVMSLLQIEFDQANFYTEETFAWDEALTFWNNLKSFYVTKVGYSIYIVFYALLILSNAIPFASNMYQYHTNIEVKKIIQDSNTKETKVKWTLQNWLGVVTQCCTCFQIVYLCLTRSIVIQESGYIDAISYIGLIFDWFWYYIIMNISVFIWLACMYYTTFLYGYLEAYFPEKLMRMTKFHAFLADFLPNFALIFYNPCVELLAKVFDCRLSLKTSIYSNSYGIVCWTGPHWIMVVCSMILGCGFTNFVVRYCKILKLLRKDFNFKDKDWNTYLESISKTAIIILYFNIANKPNSVWWYDYIRGSLYAYCGVIYAIMFAFEISIQPKAYTTRKRISQVLPLIILISTALVCLIAHSYAIVKFKAGLTDLDKKKQEEELKKFFAAFVDELDSGVPELVYSHSIREGGYAHSIREAKQHHPEQITSFASFSPSFVPSVGEALHVELLTPNFHHMRRGSDAESTCQPIPLKDAQSLASSQNIFSMGHWAKLDELINRAGTVGLIEGDELKAVKLAVTFQDPIIPILFARCNKNLFTFTELLKVKVWQGLADEPVNLKSTRPPSWRDAESIKGSQFSIAASVARRESGARRKSGTRRGSNARSLKAANSNDVGLGSSENMSLKIPSSFDGRGGSSGDLSMIMRPGAKSAGARSFVDGRAGSHDFSMGMPASALKPGSSSKLARPRSILVGSHDNVPASTSRISATKVSRPTSQLLEHSTVNIEGSRHLVEHKKADEGHILFSEPKRKLSESEWLPLFSQIRPSASRTSTIRPSTLIAETGKPDQQTFPLSPNIVRRTSSKKSSRKTSLGNDFATDVLKSISRRTSKEDEKHAQPAGAEGLDVNSVRGGSVIPFDDSYQAGPSSQRASVVKLKPSEFGVIQEESDTMGLSSSLPMSPSSKLKLTIGGESEVRVSPSIRVTEEVQHQKRSSTSSRTSSRPVSAVYAVPEEADTST
ncbi:UNVERIFIED_CONTAM: hypothetical protein HDU68_010600 [Siphonaria sp. JEL0065]|nr:hypothetical protein HDU68_010600 [Siphonaria sp. JEL0065]